MLGASYIIWTFRRVIYGEMGEKISGSDFKMPKMEFIALVVFAALIILFGLMPSLLYEIINPAFSQFSSLGGAL